MTKTKDNILKSAVEEKVQKPAPQAPVISPQQEEEVKQEMQQTMQENLQKPTASAEVLQTKPAPKPEPKTYSEMFDIINPYTPPTAEELEAERRKRRSKAVVKALGDGLSSLANIYFTSKGAPAVKYDPRGSLSERGKARWDKIDQMRDEKMTRYATDKMKAMEADIRQKNAEKLLDLRAKMNEAEAKARADLHAQDDAAKVEHTNLVNAFKAEDSAKKHERNLVTLDKKHKQQDANREDTQAHQVEENAKKRENQNAENEKNRQAKEQNIITAAKAKEGNYEVQPKVKPKYDYGTKPKLEY